MGIRTNTRIYDFYDTLNTKIEAINEDIKRLDNRVKALEKEQIITQERKNKLKEMLF